MVTIVNYKTYQKKEDREKFFALVVQGGLKLYKATGERFYEQPFSMDIKPAVVIG